MFFTEQDYKRIESWIKLNSIKDSDMVPIEKLQDDDTIVLSKRLGGNTFQNGKIKASDLMSQIWEHVGNDVIYTRMVRSQAITPNKLSQEVYDLFGNRLVIEDLDSKGIEIYIDSEGNIYAESYLNIVGMDINNGDIYIQEQ